MTQSEKCRLLHGQTLWSVRGSPRHDIADWTMSNGPAGVRGRGEGVGIVLPAAVALGATWNPTLVERIGEAIGQEALDRQVQVVLAPTLNLHRVPEGGRTFECFSEDPELTAATGAAFIAGVQQMGVAACAKHLVGNEQELRRRTQSSEIDERTLREVYLVPFERAVTHSGVRGVMAAYNRLNATPACEDSNLLTTILRDEWGFDGIVVTDWGAMASPVESASAGIDVEMPGGGHWGADRLFNLVSQGEVAAEAVDRKARRVLQLLEWTEHLVSPGEDHEADEEPHDRDEHRRLARRAAADATVLAANPQGLLPLDLAKTRSIALIGPFCERPPAGGGGSAELTAWPAVDLPAAMAWYLPHAAVRVAQGVSIDRRGQRLPDGWVISRGTKLELFDGPRVVGQPAKVVHDHPVRVRLAGDTWPSGYRFLSMRQTLMIQPDITGPCRLIVVGLAHTRLLVDGVPIADNAVEPFRAARSLNAGDGIVHFTAGEKYRIELQYAAGDVTVPIVASAIRFEAVPDVADETASIVEAARVAGSSDVAVVMVGTGPQFESEHFDRPDLQLPGRQNELVERTFAANPNTVVVVSTGGPVEMPWFDQAAAVLVNWFPGQEGAAALADVLTGAADPAGRMPTTWPMRTGDGPAHGKAPLSYPGDNGQVHYLERTLVGHRWYEANQVVPRLPFGHGGSYAAFDWHEPAIDIGDDPTDIRISVAVARVGDHPGFDVVQCYVAPTKVPGTIARAPQRLVGFAKVDLWTQRLATAVIELDKRAFARWDVDRHEWVVDPGVYELRLGRSSADAVFTEPVTI